MTTTTPTTPTTPSTPGDTGTVVDPFNDGKYWVNVSLYHTTMFQASMGNVAFQKNPQALVITSGLSFSLTNFIFSDIGMGRTGAFVMGWVVSATGFSFMYLIEAIMLIANPMSVLASSRQKKSYSQS